MAHKQDGYKHNAHNDDTDAHKQEKPKVHETYIIVLVYVLLHNFVAMADVAAVPNEEGVKLYPELCNPMFVFM